MNPRMLGRSLLLTWALACFPLHVCAQEDRIVYEIRSQYQLITVRDTASGYRQLIFDGDLGFIDAIQSEMNLANPTELTLSYSRHIMAALPLASKLKRILVIGLGGACMQRYLYNLLPEVKLETAELDPAVRDVALNYFQFKEDDRQVVHLGDGRKFLENSKDKYDIIFLDAFSATSIPYPLTTREFLEFIKNHLAEGGIACANLWDGEASYGDMLKTYSSVFEELHVIKCSFSGNSILVAFPVKRGLTVPKWVEKATAFENIHPTALNLPQLIQKGAMQADIPSGATVLVDKKAPEPE